MYFYTHIVSYYEKNDRKQNLYDIFKVLNNAVLSSRQSGKNLIIYSIIIDEKKPDLMINQTFDKLKELENDKYDILVSYRYNTGGTVQTMYLSYKYLIDNNINSKYIGVWEDDCIFKDNYLLDIVDEYLKKDNIYVGSYWECESGYALNDNEIGGIKQLKTNNLNRTVPWCRVYHIHPNSKDDTLIPYNKYKWCEDPYITTLDNLKKIEDKLGIFTLAPTNEKYTHCEHGINYGEVGFPTRLSINGFKFFGLSKQKFFTNLNDNTIGNKRI
jgi:hypothetical protein